VADYSFRQHGPLLYKMGCGALQKAAALPKGAPAGSSVTAELP